MVYDGADEHLEGSRGAKTAAGQNGGFYVGIEAGEGAAQLGKSCRHTANEGRGGVDLCVHGGQLPGVHLAKGIALGENTDKGCAVYTDSRHGIQIHSRRQYTTPLVIGMVTADLCSAGSRKIALRRATELSSKTRIQSGFYFVC